MGGRHLKLFAEVELLRGQAAAIQELAEAYGLVVMMGPGRLGLSCQEQVDAIRSQHPTVKIDVIRHTPPAPPAKHHNPGFLKLVEEVLPRVRQISPGEAHKMTKAGGGARLIDVREDHEWNQAHAQGAVHLGRGILEQDIETQVKKKDFRVILYCGNGCRSALAADSLQKMGYKDVLSVAGGFGAWKAGGLPEEN